MLLQWQTAFPHRRFYLFADSSVPEGTLPAQIERCTMEGWLTDSVASAKLLGWSVRPLPFHCTTLAMSCPAPRLAASVLGLLYSNRGGRTASALCAHRRPEGLKWRAHEAKRSAQSKAAKRLEARGHAQRASAPEHRAAEGEGGAQRRNTGPPTAGRTKAARCARNRPLPSKPRRGEGARTARSAPQPRNTGPAKRRPVRRPQ